MAGSRNLLAIFVFYKFSMCFSPVLSQRADLSVQRGTEFPAPGKFSEEAKHFQHRWAGDVPIMNGLSIEPELGFAFDSPDGRIVMIFASSTVSASKIMGFYGSTLGQLGWGGGNGNWTRGDEKLVIGVVQTARGPLWRIMLQPH